MITLLKFDVQGCNQEKFDWGIGTYFQRNQHGTNKCYPDSFWLGENHWTWGEIGESPLLKSNRQQLWEVLNDRKAGLPRYFRNLRKMVLCGYPSNPRKDVDYRVLCLIDAAQSLNYREHIVLVYECDRAHAEMIARCIEWVADELLGMSEQMKG